MESRKTMAEWLGGAPTEGKWPDVHQKLAACMPVAVHATWIMPLFANPDSAYCTATNRLALVARTRGHAEIVIGQWQKIFDRLAAQGEAQIKIFVKE